MCAPTPWRVAAPGRQQLDVNPDVVRHAAGEQAGLLHQRQVAGVGQPRLEGLNIFVDRVAERNPCEIRQVVDPHGRAKALLAERLEVRPRHDTGVALQHKVPVLGSTRHVEGSEANLVAFSGALRPEELFTPVEPTKRIFTAVEGWEGQLVIVWNADGLVLSGAPPW
jgi:hypothetical protein